MAERGASAKCEDARKKAVLAKNARKVKVVEVSLSRATKGASKVIKKKGKTAAATKPKAPAKAVKSAKQAVTRSGKQAAAKPAVKPVVKSVVKSSPVKAPAAAKAAPAKKAAPVKESPTKVKVSAPAPAAAETDLGKEVPVFLTTTSEETLRSFRAATKRSRAAALANKPKRFPGATFLAKGPKKGKRYVLDLRIHSPGTTGYFSTGGVDPGPALIRLAKVKGIDMVGLTDYYNATYVDLVRKTAAQSNVTFIPGVTIRCVIGNCREVFLICLFPESFSGEDVFCVLDDLNVPREAYGSREYCIERDFGEVLRIVEGKGGIVIPSRLDKTPYRQTAIPALVEQYGIHAFDLVHPDNTDFFKDRWPFGAFTFFSFSNANALAQIGSRVSKVRLAVGGFEGIKEAVARRTAKIN